MAGTLFVAAAAVLGSRTFLSSATGQEFLAAYPGAEEVYPQVKPGVPQWLSWSHFFNMFFMALLISTGWRVRTEGRPPAIWRPRGNARIHISITVWAHLFFDVLWVLNGFIYVTLLFVTGRWVRLVPTRWDILPNALSALLQYLTLDWPTSNGWVGYNALQQIFYFLIVFIAAPLAVVSGLRLSPVWPRRWRRLSARFTKDHARHLHVGTMLFFVVFVIVHVTLVLGTGALRNLNAMMAAQGDPDPTVYAHNWTGFWILVAALLAIIAAVVAISRPAITAAMARTTGEVSQR